MFYKFYLFISFDLVEYNSRILYIMGSKKRTSFKTEREFYGNQWNNTANLKVIENVEHVNPKTQTLFSVSACKIF